MTDKPKLRKTCKWCQSAFWSSDYRTLYCPSEIVGKSSKCMMKARQFRYMHRIKSRLKKLEKMLNQAGVEVTL